ncbi:outer membrane protein [Phreatobacter sp.]|uniref:outer membrane protein n=1 Tax=Phreatobacter sp. TaxID=1966341 RepID=UPI003F70BDCF
MRKIFLATAAAITFGASAQAADLASPRMPIATAVVVPVFNWTGFYGGLNIGVGFVNTNLGGFVLPFPLSGSGTGIVAGAQIGYNHQINNLVVGLEGDLGYFGVSRRAGDGAGNFIAWRTQWDASIRARLGIAVDRTLLYVTGGVAFADLRISGVAGQPIAFFPFAESQTRVGWTLGAGIEHAVTQNWTVRAEYLYANYGRRDFPTIPLAGVRMETHKFRVGINYLFSTGPSAVVARY